MEENSASPTARILPTSTHTSIPNSLPTINPRLVKTPFPTATPSPFDSRVSPNGEFIANAYLEHQLPSGLQTIEIRDKQGKLIWQIPYQGEPSTSDPSPLLSVLQWSKDSSLLYFYYVFSPDGGDRAFWWTGLDLQTIDVNTGEIKQVLPGEGFMSFAISPDGTQIAYTRSQDNPSIFYLRDLSTRAEKTAPVIFGSKDYARVGDIRWSPSGKEIAFQTETKEYMAQTIYLNPSTLKQKVVREYMVDSSYFQGWSVDGNLEFIDLENGVYIVHVNPRNGKTIVIGTPTPRP